MKFRNPWIDPCVLQVKPAHAESYLLKHGWIPITSVNPRIRAFAISSNPAEAAVVAVAQLTDARDYPQCVIDLVAGVAFAEDRWAVDVLSDILQAKGMAAPVNGVGVAHEVGSAAS